MRELIRDTKKIKVRFGSFQSNILGPRKCNNLKDAKPKHMMEVENELNQQSKKLELSNRVQSSSLFNSRSNSIPNEDEKDEDGLLAFKPDL